MKLLASLALIGGLAAFRPATSEGQVRVHVDIGAPYNVGYRYDRFHRVGWYPKYFHYDSYPAEVVIVRRPFRPAPIIVVGPRYYRYHRRYW